MAEIVKEIIIKAPPEKIFNVFMKSENRLKIWPSLMEIKNEKQLPNGGYRADWVYKIAGVYFGGTSECIDVVPGKQFSIKFEGSINCLLKCTFTIANEGFTKVSINLHYQDYLKILTRFSENRNEREAEIVLANLRELIEKS
jgi:uncharacterized protein YndB with AHSA1/START domain